METIVYLTPEHPNLIPLLTSTLSAEIFEQCMNNNITLKINIDEFIEKISFMFYTALKHGTYNSKSTQTFFLMFIWALNYSIKKTKKSLDSDLIWKNFLNSIDQHNAAAIKFVSENLN